MKNFIFYILIIYLLYSTKSSKIDKPTEIDEDYINENFDNLSKNLVQSFTKISNSGNITLLDTFLSKLAENK